MTNPTNGYDANNEETKLLTVPESTGATRRDLAAEKAERDRSLGKVARVSSDVDAPVAPKRTTDRFLGSLGLFVLRLVTAAIIGIHGYQHLVDLPKTADMLSQTAVPSPSIMAIVLGASEIAIALGLLLGILTRLAGLGLMLVTIGALVFVLWGVSNPFQAGSPGFRGELELLLAAVGFVFLTLGAGGWSIDAGWRRRRVRAKETL